MEEKEIWKDIPGYEGSYQASTLGRIKSLSLRKEKILKQSIRKKYLCVTLSLNAKLRCINVHQLIMLTFYNHVYKDNNLVTDHIDSNPMNNKLNNLRLVTNRENCSREKTFRSGLPVGVGTLWSRGKLRNKFRANITINYKRVHLGNFNTVEEASEAYQLALTKINNNEQL